MANHLRTRPKPSNRERSAARTANHPDNYLPPVPALRPGKLHIRILGHPRRRRSPLACDQERRAVTLEIQFDRNFFWITGLRPAINTLITKIQEKPTPYPHHWPLAGMHAVRYDPARDEYSTLSTDPAHSPQRRKKRRRK